VAAKPDFPIVSFSSGEEWEAWLESNHSTSRGVWIAIAKKGSGIASVAYPEVLETALCHGWIDGQRRARDERVFLQKFTPRGPLSRWSRINRDKALELIRLGRMKPAGLDEVERARADGRWDAAYEGQRAATVPADLQRELDRNPAAAEFFATLNSQNRYSILYRLQDAKRPETRARRLAKFVAMLNAGEKIHP
jgi:uncharacterized protein YdeI (YjbR/CyaY-like superfamily)